MTIFPHDVGVAALVELRIMCCVLLPEVSSSLVSVDTHSTLAVIGGNDNDEAKHE